MITSPKTVYVALTFSRDSGLLCLGCPDELSRAALGRDHWGRASRTGGRDGWGLGR